MNKELQRIKIAEACGCTWKVLMTHDGWVNRLDHTTWTDAELKERNSWAGEPNNVRDQILCPDCLSDLNACAEMEKVMTADQWRRYPKVLAKVIGGNMNARVHIEAGILLSATAPQRCEAFLRTLGLWQEPLNREEG